MPVGRAVAKLAVPTVISQIVVILYSLADTFFVGQIGAPNQLAALKIPCCDSELIEKIAIETGFAKEYVERFGEYAVSDSLYERISSCAISQIAFRFSFTRPTRSALRG